MEGWETLEWNRIQQLQKHKRKVCKWSKTITTSQ
jgi:hypothetical protein